MREQELNDTFLQLQFLKAENEIVEFNILGKMKSGKIMYSSRNMP